MKTLISAMCLVVPFGFATAVVQAVPQRDTLKPEVVIRGPVNTPNTGKDYFKAYSQASVQGQVVYGFDTASYTPSGYAPFWQNYFALRSFPATQPKTYSVDIPQWKLLYSPVFSPDGKQVAFRVGDPDSDGGLFSLYVWNFKSQVVTKVADESLGYSSVCWSNDSNCLAYVGGYSAQRLNRKKTPGVLRIYNLQNQETRVVANVEPIPNTLARTPQGSLLFNARPKTSEQKTEILETLPQQKEVRVLVKDAYRPIPSPERKHVAFLRYSDVPRADNKLIQKKREMICIFDRQNGATTVLAENDIDKPVLTRLFWLPNNRNIAVLRTSIVQNHDAEIEVSTYNLVTKKQKFLCYVKYKIDDSMDLLEDYALLRPIKISNDGQFLFFRLMQFDKEKERNGIFLKVINLNSGVVSTLFRTTALRDMDWHDESLPLRNVTSSRKLK